MTTLAEIIASRQDAPGGFTVALPGDWMQGRTCYGGLSSALALVAAQQLDSALPPLRSAQIAFIGPLAGTVSVTATLLRQGRNAAFVQADVSGESGLGLRAVFVFMRDQRSAAAHDASATVPPPLPAPDAKLWSGPPGFFASNMEFQDLKRDSHGPAELLRWGRLKQRDGLDPVVHLIAMGDALPPAAILLYDKGGFPPISSLTWQINLLTAEPQTQDGWWLLNARADVARHGCSSQTMTLWNADGTRIAEGTQSVALFA